MCIRDSTKAIRLINGGSRFISTNPDATGPSPEGPLPATGAINALITKATGKEPYIVGKPNPMMFRSALNKIGAHSHNTVMTVSYTHLDVYKRQARFSERFGPAAQTALSQGTQVRGCVYVVHLSLIHI